jgi:ankyrin repeat protein
MVRLLLNHGAQIDIPSLTGEYPHHLAAQNGHLAILKMLCEAGADPDQGRNDGVTPLQMAVMGTADLDTIKYLLEAGAHPEKHGVGSVPSLHRAAALGLYSVARVLLEHGANPNTILCVRDGNLGCYIGSTAVVTATSKGFTDIVRLLIRYGAKMCDAKDEKKPLLIHQSVGSEACPAALFLARRCNDAAALSSLFVLFSSGVVSLKSMSMILSVCNKGNACETKSDEEAREYFSNPKAVCVMLKEIMQCRSIQYTIIPRILLAAQKICPQLHDNHPIWREVFDCVGKKKTWIRHPTLAKEREARIESQAKCDENDFRSLVSRRIRVSWNKDRSFFDGTITDFDRYSRKWTVLYDDGDVRKYDLSALTRTVCGERVAHAGRFRLLRNMSTGGGSDVDHDSEAILNVQSE